MATDTVVSIVSGYLKGFIARHPMIFLLIPILLTYLPLVPALLRGQDATEVMLNLHIIEFEYFGVPVGLTIIYLIFIPINYLYIIPYDRRLASQQAATTNAVREKFKRERAEANAALRDRWLGKRD